ncbi:hypothetical protein CHU_0583 [Cytophaga hutchinsonii ATCC 33406]|uniref:Uncharacterized protein n=2 Tax=Cytophaga hutchinsonii TaxID=985 RepID=A0A6N4SNM9_CYTH3|nr:hypothetical protein CHU_0583 [Cytophaga hutchinsonii ATCC 33406]
MMSYWRDPIDKRPVQMYLKLAAVVFIFSIVLFSIIFFFIPAYRKRLIRKLHERISGSAIIDSLKLKININDQLYVIFFAKPHVSEFNQITVESSGDNIQLINKILYNRSVKELIEKCEKEKSSVKKISRTLTKLSAEAATLINDINA